MEGGLREMATLNEIGAISRRATSANTKLPPHNSVNNNRVE